MKRFIFKKIIECLLIYMICVKIIAHGLFNPIETMLVVGMCFLVQWHKGNVIKVVLEHPSLNQCSIQHQLHVHVINNYWMRLSMIAIIINAKVWVICRSQRLRRITQTEALIIIAIKPNPIIVLLCIFPSCICKDKRAHKKWSMYSGQLVSKQFSCLYRFISLQPFVRSKASSKFFQSLKQMNCYGKSIP